MHYRVKHLVKGYVGVTDGTTRFRELFEDPSDEEEVRVRVSDGTSRIASEANLVRLEPVDNEEIAFDVITGRGLKKAAEDINALRVPDECLVDLNMWRAVCRVRGLKPNAVAPTAWVEICRRRGYLLYRQNLRGF